MLILCARVGYVTVEEQRAIVHLWPSSRQTEHLCLRHAVSGGAWCPGATSTRGSLYLFTTVCAREKSTYLLAVMRAYHVTLT